jgi:hypothetical protein
MPKPAWPSGRVIPARSGFHGTLRCMKCRTRHSPMERRFIAGRQKFPNPLLWNLARNVGYLHGGSIAHQCKQPNPDRHVRIGHRPQTSSWPAGGLGLLPQRTVADNHRRARRSDLKRGRPIANSERLRFAPKAEFPLIAFARECVIEAALRGTAASNIMSANRASQAGPTFETLK